ncbi:MAG: hypothetical protein AB7N76_25950 [Planctomycetota bacterium]
MILLVLVNDVAGLEPKQTTTRIVDIALKRGHEVLLLDLEALYVGPDGVPCANARDLTGARYQSDPELVAAATSAPRRRLPLVEADVLLMRTNPGRDRGRREAHGLALRLISSAANLGLPVLNGPDGLFRAASKRYLLEFPAEVRPTTYVANDIELLIEFVRELDGPAVIKPVCGSRGMDVFRVESADDKNLRQIGDVVLRDGFAMVQNFVPEAVDGDTRVLVLEGKLLELDGHPGAFRRIPTGADFRSNVDVGGKTAPAELRPGMRRAVELMGPKLVQDGLFLVGLDFIGDKVCEVNAYSPGGLRAARKFEGADFTTYFLERVEARARPSGAELVRSAAQE